MFSIFKSVTLFFPKHRNFRVFWCNISEDLWRPREDERTKIQEASEDVTKGGIIFPSSKISYMEANTQKEEEIGVLGTRQHSHALDTHLCAPRHLTHGCKRLAPETSLTCVCRMVLGTWRLFLVGQGVVLWIFGGKACYFSLSLGGNSPYKYCSPHTLCPIQN